MEQNDWNIFRDWTNTSALRDKQTFTLSDLYDAFQQGKVALREERDNRIDHLLERNTELVKLSRAKETPLTVKQWADDTFGRSASNIMTAARGLTEYAELVMALAQNDVNEAAKKEVGDIIVCLYRLAVDLGMDLSQAIDEIMEVNRNQREWKPDGFGHGQHVKKGEAA